MKIVIIGTGGMGREALWILRACDKAKKKDKQYDIVGFVTCTQEEHGTEICGIPVLGTEEWLVGKKDIKTICAIGDPRDRINITQMLDKKGISFTSVIHPSVEMSDYVTIGEGCIISAGCILTTQVEIGNHVIVNLNTTVSHDCILEDFVTLAPGVNIAGRVRIGYGTEIGTNCTVIPKVKIGRGAIIGAQSTVIRNIKDNTVAAGVPAKVIKPLAQERWI